MFRLEPLVNEYGARVQLPLGAGQSAACDLLLEERADVACHNAVASRNRGIDGSWAFVRRPEGRALVMHTPGRHL